jgi:hypothetical protein
MTSSTGFRPWGAVVLFAATVWAQQSGENCTFQNQPDKFLSGEARSRAAVYERTLAYTRGLAASAGGATLQTVSPASLPVRNFIDEEIFAKLTSSGMQAAALSTDEEFLRRVKLDLTGRIPTAAEVRAFVADNSPTKRDTLVEKLVYSPEFVDKWTLWLGDLLQNAASAQNRSQQIEGRNRMHEWIRAAIAFGKSWRDVATEVITAQGNNYDRSAPTTNYILRGYAPAGPAQDTSDLLLVKTATNFLGLSHYDCLLCHNGKRHLDSISVWGAGVTRLEAYRMAAHFSHVSMTGYSTTDKSDFYYNSYTVSERTSGTYALSTNYGNRPNRVAVTENGKSVTSVTPVYRDGTAASGAWRESLARSIVADPMFARNYANRIWKAMFNLALAEPVDALDPARLDPNVAPPTGWDYQASHPQLLEKLANLSRQYDFNLREILRVIVRSSAYQLSSRYSDSWNSTQASLFARHLPRRLEAEEMYDAMAQATGVYTSFTVGGWVDPVSRAMQLPEPMEPRSNSTVLSFLNSFNRGNRDTVPRSHSGSILMWLNTMNSSVVMNRMKATGTTASPYLAGLLTNTDNSAVAEDMFLTFLSRLPTEYEKGIAVKYLAKATTPATRVTAVEDLAWALTNKIDFLLSY